MPLSPCGFSRKNAFSGRVKKLSENVKLRYPGCFIKLHSKIIGNRKFRDKFSIPCSKAPWKGKTIFSSMRIAAL